MPSKTASQPPKPGASPDEWQEYALIFDGYEHAGGTEAAERIYLSARKQILAGKPITGTTDYLRTGPPAALPVDGTRRAGRGARAACYRRHPGRATADCVAKTMTPNRCV